MAPSQQRGQGVAARIGRWRLVAVLFVLGSVALWLPFREGHGIAVPQVAWLLAWFVAWGLVFAFALDLLFVQLLHVAGRRDAAVCIFELLFLAGVGLFALLHELHLVRGPANNAVMAGLVPLVETYRGGTREGVHFGALAVVDRRGQVLAHAGDPHWVTFTRSTLKPLQALPFLQGGGVRHFGLTPSNLALLCASHSGEPMHVEQVEQILARAGVGYKRLQCGCHVPMFAELGAWPPPAPGSYDERHHNCSGKHGGFLAYCVQHGQPLETYLQPTHPLQQAIRAAVAEATGLQEHRLAAGTDGCSAPNYAMPLAHLAQGFARLASGLQDARFGESFAALADAMTAHPELVSGTGRNDLAFMAAGRGDWVTKVGAEGVQVVASRSRAEALALKISDGNKLALYAATVAALDQLGWLDDGQREALRPWRNETIASVKGDPVGERKAVFRLQGAVRA